MFWFWKQKDMFWPHLIWRCLPPILLCSISHIAHTLSMTWKTAYCELTDMTSLNILITICVGSIRLYTSTQTSKHDTKKRMSQIKFVNNWWRSIFIADIQNYWQIGRICRSQVLLLKSISKKYDLLRKCNQCDESITHPSLLVKVEHTITHHQ